MKRVLKTISSFIPRTLPTGLTTFNKWVNDIVYLSGLPDNQSTRHLAAQFIIHTPPYVTTLSVHHVVKQLRKAAAYQVAKAVLSGTTINDPEKALPSDTTSVTSAEI